MSVELFECLSLSEASVAAGKPRVDREKGVIYGVKVLGWKSANGREYLKGGVKAELYEGRRVCGGHVKGSVERSPLDTYAYLEGISIEDSGVYARQLRLLNPKGEFEQRLMTAAVDAPHLFGLSHTATGREKAGSNGGVIESVESVASVDLVTDPATVAGLYESRKSTVKRKLKDLAEALKARRPGYLKVLREMAEAGVMSPDAEVEAPAEGENGDHEKAFVSGVVDAINKVLQDAVENGDWDAAMDQVNQYVKTIKKHMGKNGNGGANGDSPPADEPPVTTESRRLKAENAGLLAEKLVRRAAGKAGLSVSESLVEALARPGMTEAQADAVVNELRGAGGVSQKPRSAAPLAPQGGTGAARPAHLGEGKSGGGGEIPANVKDRAAWLERG